MQVSIEILYHYRCDRCQGWWSVADIAPQPGGTVTCPHCAHQNAIAGFQDGKQRSVSGVLFTGVTAENMGFDEMGRAIAILSDPASHYQNEVDWALRLQQSAQQMQVWGDGERP